MYVAHGNAFNTSCLLARNTGSAVGSTVAYERFVCRKKKKEKKKEKKKNQFVKVGKLNRDTVS